MPVIETRTASSQNKFKLVATALLFLLSTALMLAQSPATFSGSVADSKGGMIPRAAVTVHNEVTGKNANTLADAEGHFSLSGLIPGVYDLSATAPGFSTATRKGIQVAAGQPSDIALTLEIASTTSDITVDADATHSIAAALAPMDAKLSATSARTEITAAMIQNFMSPVADFGEAVEMAPGTFTTNGNGVGLGQSKTYFRGFPDGDYDIDFDGIPFYDTNSPTHHSWAFFPAQWLGGIDFDRSPGTASTIGPTPFGGSIHLLSKPFDPISNIRGQFAGGSFHTFLYDGEYDTGAFGPGHKFNIMIDVHHMQSNGYQTFNYQTRNAGDIQFQYRPSDKTTITGYSGVIWLDANTPNFAGTRCQMYGLSGLPANGCTVPSTSTLYPFTGAGINFLNTNNSDPALYLDYKYNYYHVPTDFEYVEVNRLFKHGVVIDFKPYTYNYDNSEKYTNAVPLNDDPAIAKNIYAPLGVAYSLCNVEVKGKLPCGVDKYNSYRKYGELGQITQASKFGIFRAGIWYEWAKTNRHQFPSDPLNNWADQPLSNFNEKFVTNSYQPYLEYDFHVTRKLDITAGTKFSYYTISTQQFADDGKTIGNLGTGAQYAGNPNAFITNGANYYKTLPSLDGNYRIKSNWSVYGQVATGSIVPPSSVFDYAQSETPGAPFIPLETPPKQQKSTTYQTGTVLKLKRVTFDADYYHVRFDNSYSSGSDAADANAEYFYLQPASITKGFEAESNIYAYRGISVYLNATVGRAYYTGNLYTTCVAKATGCSATPGVTPQLIETAKPNTFWVQQTPTDTETEGVTYQRKAWDLGIFNKRVGTFYLDNGAYHNQATVNPFTLTNAFINYTIRTGGRFDQTKLRLSVNNLFNEHSITGITLANSVNAAPVIAANGTTYADSFNTNGPTTINGQDNISIFPARSIMVSVIFGFSPRHN